MMLQQVTESIFSKIQKLLDESGHEYTYNSEHGQLAVWGKLSPAFEKKLRYAIAIATADLDD